MTACSGPMRRSVGAACALRHRAEIPYGGNRWGTGNRRCLHEWRHDSYPQPTISSRASNYEMRGTGDVAVAPMTQDSILYYIIYPGTVAKFEFSLLDSSGSPRESLGSRSVLGRGRRVSHTDRQTGCAWPLAVEGGERSAERQAVIAPPSLISPSRPTASHRCLSEFLWWSFNSGSYPKRGFVVLVPFLLLQYPWILVAFANCNAYCVSQRA